MKFIKLKYYNVRCKEVKKLIRYPKRNIPIIEHPDEIIKQMGLGCQTQNEFSQLLGEILKDYDWGFGNTKKN